MTILKHSKNFARGLTALIAVLIVGGLTGKWLFSQGIVPGAALSVADVVAGVLKLANGGTGCAAPFAINPQTATYQALAADFTCFKTITVASGTFTITLVDTATQPAAGTWIKVVNYGTGTITIARSGQNINGAVTSLVIPAGSSIHPSRATVESDGTNYFADLTEINLLSDGISWAGSLVVPNAKSFQWTSRGSIQANNDGEFSFNNNAGTAGFRVNGSAATLSSGFGTSPVVGGTGHMGSVNVGTGGTATSGVIAVVSDGAANHMCFAWDQTTPAKTQLMTCTPTATTITISTTSAWVASDIVGWIYTGTQ